MFITSFLRGALALAVAFLGLATSSCQLHAKPPPPGEYRRRVEAYNKETGARQISADKLKALLTSKAPVVLLDIREAHETSVSMLPGARAIPPSAVQTARLDAPPNATVITYCTVGYRSGHAAVALEKRLGRQVYNLDGGLIAWSNGGGVVHDSRGQPTTQVHPYDDEWAVYLRAGD